MSSAAGCGSSTRSIPRRSCRFSSDVEGALDYAGGRTGDAGSVGFHAAGDDVEVRLTSRPRTFLGCRRLVVRGRPARRRHGSDGTPARSVLVERRVPPLGDLARRPDAEGERALLGGRTGDPDDPLLVTLHGKSPVSEFEAGTLDYVPIGDADAAWMGSTGRLARTCAWCPHSGRRTTASTRRVRRSTTCGSAGRSPRRSTGSASFRWPARPRRSRQQHDPRGHPGPPVARLLAGLRPGHREGRPGRGGVPRWDWLPAHHAGVIGLGIDEGIVTQLKANLGIDIGYEVMEATHTSAGYRATFRRSGSSAGRPTPGRERLPRRSAGDRPIDNYGGWASPEFIKRSPRPVSRPTRRDSRARTTARRRSSRATCR